MTTPAATIACQCGEVCIAVAFPPKKQIQCCCCDCQAALKWCVQKSGSPTAPRLANLLYQPNALHVDKGMEHLRCYILNESYNTRRVVADCCWTALMGDHLIYKGEKFVTYPKHAKVTMLSEQKIPPVSLRMFLTELTDEEFDAVTPLEKEQISEVPLCPNPKIKSKKAEAPSKDAKVKKRLGNVSDGDDEDLANPEMENPQGDTTGVEEITEKKAEETNESLAKMVDFFQECPDLPSYEVEEDHREYITIQNLIEDEVDNLEIMDRNYKGLKTFWNKSYPDGPFY